MDPPCRPGRRLPPPARTQPLARKRRQLVVQRRRIHQHNRAQQVGRNVVAELHLRSAGRPSASPSCPSRSQRRDLVRLRVARNPSSSTVRLVADTRLGTESVPRSTVTVAVDVSPSWSVIVYCEGIEPFLARRRRVGEGAVAVVDRRRPWRPPSSPQPPSPGRRHRRQQIVGQRGGDQKRRAFRHRKRCRHRSPAARRRRS